VPSSADLLQERAEAFAVRVLQLIRTLPRIVVDEVDESEHWLSILKKAELATGTELDWLLRESGEPYLASP